MSEEERDEFWKVEVWPLGITKWSYAVGFLLMGIISTILLFLWFIGELLKF